MIYKIGDIAKVMGVTTEAIRHYERMGLIKPEKDPQTNYRYFTEEQLSQLLYIQRLSQMGISLQLIREQFLNGSLHSYEQVISETLQSTQERLRILQMKTSNLMNCLDPTDCRAIKGKVHLRNAPGYVFHINTALHSVLLCTGAAKGISQFFQSCGSFFPKRSLL